MKNFDITNEAVNQVRDNNFNYYTKVLAFAEIWIKTQMRSFTSYDLKDAFFAEGNPKPSEPRVFGSIFRELSKNHLIFRNGYQNSRNPICHSRPQALWISKEFRLKQQGNAVKDKNQISIFNQS